MSSKVMTMDELKAKKEKESGGLRGKKTTGEVESNIGDTYEMSPEIVTLFNDFKNPKTTKGDRKLMLETLFAHKNHKYSTTLKPMDQRPVISKYLEDFKQFMIFLNKDDNKKLIFTKHKNDKAKIASIGKNKLTVGDILGQAPKPNRLLGGIKNNYLKDNSPFTVFKTYEEIGKNKRTPSKKPTEPPIVSPDVKLEQDITTTETEIKKLEDEIKTSTNAEERSDMRDDLDEWKKALSALQKQKEIDSKPKAKTTTTPVSEPEPDEMKAIEERIKKIELGFKSEQEKLEMLENIELPTPEPVRQPPPVQPPPVQPPPVQPVRQPPTTPTATPTATQKQEQEKGRPQDPTAIDTMQPLSSKSDLIPDARLGTKGKDINDLIDDIKYFMDNFEGQLKREKGFFKNVDIRNIKELRELHDRIVGKLAPEKQKSTDGNKVGIIVNADDYIREQMKKILQEQTFSSLRPADVVIDVGSRAVEGRDTKDFGDFEVKRTIDGGLSSQREAVYRYMPSENERGEDKEEEPLTRGKKSNRIKMPKPGLNNKRTTAIRMNTRNPFRGNQNTIKLKYIY